MMRRFTTQQVTSTGWNPAPIGFTAVAPASFGNNFFGLANNFLSTQANITASQNNYLVAAQQNANALTAGSIQTSNQYFFGLANAQTQYLNNIGMEFARAANTAASKIRKGGFLSKLF